MYGREKRVLLREFLEMGLSKSEAARRLGVDRRTVHRWIEEGQLERELDDETVRYKRRPAVKRKIDEYRGIIQTRLKEFPALSAVRLFAEIRKAGYEGGYTQVKEYVRSVRPRPPVEPVVRFETPPGLQAQVDFAHFRLPWGKRWALLVVLGYSRLLWLSFFRREDMRALFDGLESAFDFFGGVPRELLFDQMRSAVVSDHRLEGGRLIENAELVRFAHHWGFRARACRPSRPQTKGKVERPIRYVRESFFYGRHFVSDEDLEARARAWLEEVANMRQHRTTGERPRERFERDELSVLLPLASKPYRRLGAPKLKSPKTAAVPSVAVQQRSLRDYGRFAETL